MNFSNQCILLTGGAGYIGSHVLNLLKKTGAEVVVLDDLSSGRKEALSFGHFIQGDLGDVSLLKSLFESYHFTAVLHFAGKIIVNESVAKPLHYYQENTQNSLQLLRFCSEYDVKHFIFSSSAAVYGHSEQGLIDEDHPCQPISPYGASKYFVEKILHDMALAKKNFSYIALRYFNVAGADFKSGLGQYFPQATHLIKIACQVALGRQAYLKIFGKDYPTRDGTCIRDYIHVKDLAYLHLRSLLHLIEGASSDVFNCGYGQGVSVQEVVDCMKETLLIPLRTQIADRREGDPAVLVANSEKMKRTFAWTPEFADLKEMIYSAYCFEKSL